MVGSDATIMCFPWLPEASVEKLFSPPSAKSGYLRLSVWPAVVDQYKLGGCCVLWLRNLMQSSLLPSCDHEVNEYENASEIDRLRHKAASAAYSSYRDSEVQTVRRSLLPQCFLLKFDDSINDFHQSLQHLIA